MVKTVKSTIPSRKHEDRELAAKTAFEPTSVEVATPRTMVILLASAEHGVLLKALTTLDRFASKLEQNGAQLVTEGVLGLLRPLMTHPELFIRRFAVKLTSELAFLPPAAQLLLDDQLTHTLVGLLNNDEDAVVKEFASSLLAELTRVKRGRDQLFDTQLVHIFCPLLAHPDPDVQKNCLQVIHNLLSDSADHSVVVGQEGFSMKVFSDLLTSEYVAIQNLSLDMLTALAQESALAEQFQQVGGVQRIFNILKNYEWKDIHAKCLELLCVLCRAPELAAQAVREGALQLLGYLDLIGDAGLRGKALDVLAQLCRVPAARKVVLASGGAAMLSPLVLEPTAPVSTAACLAAAALADDPDPAVLDTLLTLRLPTDLLTVLGAEGRDWANRGAAARALHRLLARDSAIAALVMQSEHKEVFASILDRPAGAVPVCAAEPTALCVAALASYPALRPALANPRIVTGLVRCLQEREDGDSSPLKVAALEALCGLVCEADTRCDLTDVWRALTSPAHPPPLPVMQAAARLVTLSLTSNPSLADSLVSQGVLHWLLSQSDLRTECPAWETALESLLATFLPIKFALTGRLDLTDSTKHGFYISRTPLTRQQLAYHRFPILSDLIANNSCPRQVLYVANFNCEPVLQNNSGSLSGTLRTKRSSAISQRLSDPRPSQSLLSHSLYSCEKLRTNDVHLVKYIEDVKILLLKSGFSSKDIQPASTTVEDGSAVRRKVALIGQFVAQRLSGLERGVGCSTHCLDLHINELKVELMNSIIPVGCLREGLHLERAFLFKVLADRVGLAAGLVRGPRGRGWVEVAVPVLPPPPRPALPRHLLRPNLVVDLMSDPGALYPLGSREADLYCGII